MGHKTLDLAHFQMGADATPNEARRQNSASHHDCVPHRQVALGGPFYFSTPVGMGLYEAHGKTRCIAMRSIRPLAAHSSIPFRLWSKRDWMAA